MFVDYSVFIFLSAGQLVAIWLQMIESDKLKLLTNKYGSKWSTEVMLNRASYIFILTTTTSVFDAFLSLYLLADYRESG